MADKAAAQGSVIIHESSIEETGFQFVCPVTSPIR